MLMLFVCLLVTVMEDEVPSDGDVEHQISSTDLTALDGVSGMSSRTMVATTHYVSSYRTLATRKGGTVDPVEYMLPKKALETLKKVSGWDAVEGAFVMLLYYVWCNVCVVLCCVVLCCVVLCVLRCLRCLARME